MVISQNLDKISNTLENDENPPNGYIDDERLRLLRKPQI